jgi:plastocyanin
MARLAAIIVTGLGSLSLCGQASAADVNANGNPVSGGLGYAPAEVSATVGELVRWTNTDNVAPHDAVEASDLWRLPTFGPGEFAERAFEAGTFEYFCSIHGAQAMNGVVRVPPEVRLIEREGAPALRVTWAPGRPVSGQVFDVQRRKGGRWRDVADGTTKPAKTFAGASGRFRARLRSESDASAASNWSPPARAAG